MHRFLASLFAVVFHLAPHLQVLPLWFIVFLLLSRMTAVLAVGFLFFLFVTHFLCPLFSSLFFVLYFNFISLLLINFAGACGRIGR